MIGTVGQHFVDVGFVDSMSVAVDSTLIRAAGHVWHALDRARNILPIPGIDKLASWGITGAKKWIYGYKLHVVCSVGKLVVPLSACFTSGNIPDRNMYESLITAFGGSVQNVLADAGYDADKLYKLTEKQDMRLIAVINKIGKNTKPKRQERYNFYHSQEGQLLHKPRRSTIEPLFEAIKSTFEIKRLKAREKQVETSVLSCVLAYQIIVYHNWITGRGNNLRDVRSVLYEC